MAGDPLTPGVVYAGTRDKGVLRSPDGGTTWGAVGMAGRWVTALAVSRAEPGTVYAGTRRPCVYVTRDGGAHWTELRAFRRVRGRRFWFSPAERPFTAYVQAIALAPTDPHAIVVGIEFGAVLCSADGGQTWSGHRPGALRDCHTLTFHSTDRAWVYEGGGTGAGVACSCDGGRTWTQPRAGLDRHYGWAVAADPAQPEVWYASVAPSARAAHSAPNAQAYIVRKTGGAPWQRLGGGLPQPLAHMVYALLTDPTAPGQVYAGLSNGDVWQSADQGDTWQRLPFTLGGIHRTLLMW